MKHSKPFDIAFIGGGASALMARANLPENLHILIIDSNKSLASKLKISGGGNCNITNAHVSCKNYLGDEDFISEILKNASPQEIMDFFAPIEFIKKGEKYFSKNGSKVLINHLLNLCKNFTFLNSCKVEKVKKDKYFSIFTNKGEFLSSNLVISSGGLSYPALGASGIGYDIAKYFTHEISSLSPALVGLSLQKDQWWFKELSGVCLPVKISINDKVFQDDMLFTHKGISGPAVLNASLYWSKGLINIDFLPFLHENDLFKLTNKRPSTAFSLPKSFIKAYLKNMQIEDKEIRHLNLQQKQQIKALKSYAFAPAGNFGYSKAEITKGGVKTDLINPRSLESKLQKGLYFLGEVLDVSGELGGYNIHFAFNCALSFARNFHKI